MDFLRVTLLPSCDIGNARPVPSDEPDTTLSVEVLEEKTDFVIVVAPVAARHEKYAAAVATLLTGETVNHRSIVAGVDNSVRPLSEKVAAAHLTGRPVIIVDDVDAETATVSLRRVGEEERSGLTYTEALEMIEDDIDDPVYRARWFYEFDGGCIRYDIDAKGLGAQSVRFDIARAIGMYPMAEIYDLAREAGYGGFE